MAKRKSPHRGKEKKDKGYKRYKNNEQLMKGIVQQLDASSKSVDKTSVMFNNHGLSNAQEDRISTLPEDIKLFILSLVPTQDAVRTSVLSKQWKLLWTHVPTLDFDGVVRMAEVRRACSRGRWYKVKHVKLCKFAEQINQAMKVHSQVGVSNLDKLRVRLYPHSYAVVDQEVNELNEWVNFALDKKVKILELDLICSFGGDYQSWTASTTLSDSIWTHKFLSTGLNRLRVLSLRGVNASGPNLEHFLHNCTLLEELSVASSINLTRLRVCGSGQSVSSSYHRGLRKLEIIYCKNLEHLEIGAENLTHFKLLVKVDYGRDSTLNLLLNSVPSLVDLCLSGDQLVAYLSTNRCTKFRDVLSQLCNLTLVMYRSQFGFGDQDLCDLKQLPLLPNLKQLCLRMNCAYQFFPVPDYRLFYACPFLEEFTLEISVISARTSAAMPIETRQKNKLEHLKRITVIGWTGSYDDSQLLVDVVGMTTNLKKMTFDARDPSAAEVSAYPYEYLAWGKKFSERSLKARLVKAQLFVDMFIPPCAKVELLPHANDPFLPMVL